MLRLLVRGGSSGVLRLRAPRASGRLVIAEGRVLQASLDTVPKLGDALVAKGVVAKNQLDGALSIQFRGRRDRPLGQILVELGLVERGDVGIALEDQIRAVVNELLTWREGSYAFESNGRIPERGDFGGVDIEDLLKSRKAAR